MQVGRIGGTVTSSQTARIATPAASGSFPDRLGSLLVGVVRDSLGILRLAVSSVPEAFRAPESARRCIHRIWFEQVRFTGVNALALCCAVGGIVGAIVTIQSMAILPQVGAADSLGRVMAMVVIRELGPLLVAFIIIGRSATAVSVELGTMVVGEETAALRSLGIPLRPYVVFPRIAGITTATIGLLIYFDLAAIICGYLVSSLLISLPPGFFLSSLARHTQAVDVLATFAKGFLFGSIISSVACYYGLSVRRSPTEIPQAATKTVVVAILLCLCADLLLALGFLGP
jgi:phospholipid/cholesterol/gamma-HCH transport system permease protein